MALVFFCQPGNASTLSGSPVPAGYSLATCRTGEGAWTDFSAQTQSEIQAYMDANPPGTGGSTFDPSQLDTEALAAAWGAGFITMGIGLVIAWAARIVLSAVKG